MAAFARRINYSLSLHVLECSSGATAVNLLDRIILIFIHTIGTCLLFNVEFGPDYLAAASNACYQHEAEGCNITFSRILYTIFLKSSQMFCHLGLPILPYNPLHLHSQSG